MLHATNQVDINTGAGSSVDDSPAELIRIARAETMAKEQEACTVLKPCYRLARQNRCGFYLEEGLLYHKETLLGHKVKQLVLPKCGWPIVLQKAHDGPCWPYGV
jgi:hypothetical protein